MGPFAFASANKKPTRRYSKPQNFGCLFSDETPLSPTYSTEDHPHKMLSSSTIIEDPKGNEEVVSPVNSWELLLDPRIAGTLGMVTVLICSALLTQESFSPFAPLATVIQKLPTNNLQD